MTRMKTLKKASFNAALLESRTPWYECILHGVFCTDDVFSRKNTTVSRKTWSAMEKGKSDHLLETGVAYLYSHEHR